MSLMTNAILPLSQLLKWQTIPQMKRCGTVRKRYDLHINLHSLHLLEYNLLYISDLAADAADLKSARSNPMGVQVPLRAPIESMLYIEI